MNKYFVTRVDDDEISPEETLADSLSGHSLVEIPIGRNVFRFFYIASICILAAFLFQAYRLQVARGEHFQELAKRSQFNRIAVPSLRGVIRDTHGTVLAQNIALFDLVAVRSELLADRDSKKYLQLDAIVDFGTSNVPTILDDHADDGIFTMKKNISKDEAIRVQAANIPGIYVVPYARRSYEFGPLFSHVIGYTAQISADELKAAAPGSYSLNDRVGRLGIEAYYENMLHGEVRDILLVGSTTTQLSDARGGSDLTLYIDADMQKALGDSMREVFAIAGVRRGAAVVQDIHSGAVLAIISMPTFDPNVFEEGSDPSSKERIASILSDANKPLFNRVISGLYAPGSTIKMLYALAGLREKLVDASTTVYADGAIEIQSEVDPEVYYTYRDWKVHGLTDLRKSIAWSVDIYYYALGGGYGDIRGLGIDRMEQYLKMFLADKKTGIDLPAEAKGFIPSKKWKKEKKNDAWYVGDSYNVSIGQGDLSVTPLWINTYVSAIANGGTLMKPMVVKKIVNPATGEETVMEQKVLSELPFDPAHLQLVREGMRQTITDGTAQMLKGLPRPVAAKTGTAQVTGSGLNSLFTVYGPYDNPEIALTVLVENIPQSQSLGVQVANKFFMWYFQSHESIL